jgi:hypothetical protein
MSLSHVVNLLATEYENDFKQELGQHVYSQITQQTTTNYLTPEMQLAIKGALRKPQSHLSASYTVTATAGNSIEDQVNNLMHYM